MTLPDEPRDGVTRREVLQAAGAIALTAAGAVRGRAAAKDWDTIVVGAGVFGAWTAWHLRRRASGCCSSTRPVPPTRGPRRAASRA